MKFIFYLLKKENDDEVESEREDDDLYENEIED